MNIIGISSPIVAPAATQTTVPAFSAPAYTDSDSAQAVGTVSSSTNNADNAQTSYDAQAVEQKRLEAVQQRSQEQGNIYVVSDREFSVFKDATGQYITRYTSLRDGKVTYVPEQQTFSLSSAIASTQPFVKIKA